MAIVSPAGHGEPPGPELPGQSPGIQENPIMTAETSIAAAPARPARSLAAVAAFPGQRRVRPPGSECRDMAEPSRGLGEAAREPIKLGSAGEPE
jgi:hypothetical protein